MGISYLADSVTGQAFAKDEEIIAVIIARKTGGYPDAVKAAALAGIYPNHLFEAVSLPIRGKVGDYGDIKPHANQASVDLLLKMTRQDSWDAFADKAFDMNGGVQMPDLRMPGQPESPPEILGVWAVSEPTWKALTARYNKRANRDEDIDLVYRAVLDASTRGHDDYNYVMRANILHLEYHRGDYKFSDGSVEKMPELAHALSSMDFNGKLSEAIRIFWNFNPDGMGQRLFEKGAGSIYGQQLCELLGGFYDSLALSKGLALNGRYLLPSPSAGQYENKLDVAQMSLASLGHAIEASIERAVDSDNEDRLEKISDLLGQFGELKQKLEAQINEAKAHFQDYNSGLKM